MQATGQNNGPNIVICQDQKPVVSMLTLIENHVMTLKIALLQSIAGQFYDSCTIVITQTLFQMKRQESSPINIKTMCIFKINQAKCTRILITSLSITLLTYYQSSRIMEKLP